MFTAKFIKASGKFDAEYTGRLSSPLFRKKFTLDDTKKAKISFCGLGYGYVFLNGKSITNDLFTAPVSTYQNMVWYNEYNVTKFLKNGENVIAVILGNGFFNENFPSHWNNNKAPFRDNPKFALSLEVNGKVVLESDDEFLCQEGSFVINNALRSGETFDARLYDSKWKDLDFDDSAWKKAVLDNEKKFNPKRLLCRAEPIREIKTYTYKSCMTTKDGYVLDFGQNMSGYIRCDIDEAQGTEIKFSHAEEVNVDGTLKLNGLNVLYPTVDFQVDRYICNEQNYVWSPKFTYHGFRYVLVEGLSKPPKKSEIKAVRVHQQIERKADFKCSNELLNKIYDAGIMATYSNMHYALTDCPTREKFGWINDAQASAEQLAINFKVDKFLDKWLDDFIYSIDDKQIPAIIPTHGYGYHHGPVADGAFFELPYRYYQYSGDSSLLIKVLPYLKDYFDFYLSDKNKNTEWLLDWDGYSNNDISPEFVFNTYKIKFCNILMLAQKLNGEKINPLYKDEKQKSIDLLSEKFIDKDGKSVIDSQTGIAVLLYCGIGKKRILKDQLKEKLKETDNHMRCGMLGLQHIYDALSENGLADYAYKLVTAKGEPSYSAWFDKGATTLWETFRDSGFTDSRNHHMYSNVLAWLHNTVLGIKVNYDEGFKVDICPKVYKYIDRASGYLTLGKKKLCVDYKVKNNTLTVKVILPKGVKATCLNTPLKEGKNVIKESI